MKKIISILLTLVLMFSFALNTFAATTDTYFDKLVTYINNNGTYSDGYKTIVRLSSSTDYDFYYAIQKRGSGIYFNLLSSSDNSSYIGTNTEFVLYKNNKSISVEHTMLYYSYGTCRDVVSGVKSMDRSTYTPNTTYYFYKSGSYISSSDFSENFNACLELLCTYWDTFFYSNLGFGLEEIGFLKFPGKGTGACDPASGQHKGYFVTNYESAHPHKQYKKCSSCDEIIYTGVTKKVEDCSSCYPHVHTYKTYYEAAHPHKEYKKCTTCKEWSYTGETRTVSTCKSCPHVHTYKTYYEAAHPHKEYKKCTTCKEWSYTGKTRTVSTCKSCPHVHTYKTYYEGAHPHKEYKKCTTCKTWSYTGTTRKVDTCKTCNPCEHTYKTYYEGAHPHKAYKKCTKCKIWSYTGATKKVDSCKTCNPCEHTYKTYYEGAHPHKEYKKCTKCNTWSYTGKTKTLLKCETCAGHKHVYKTANEGAHPHKEYKKCTKCTYYYYTGNTKANVNCKTCHTHTYKTYYEGAHPHKQYKKCTSCNTWSYTGATRKVTSCATCMHVHKYSAATCTKAATCSCGVTKGSALGHNYSNGACTRCGVTKVYSVGETWVVNGQWEFTVLSAKKHYMCNRYADENGMAECVIITYSYKNLGYTGKYQDLYISSMSMDVYDGSGEAAETYPCTHTTYPKVCSVGMKCSNAQEAYALYNNSSKITIDIEYYTSNGTGEQKARFVVPVS